MLEYAYECIEVREEENKIKEKKIEPKVKIVLDVKEEFKKMMEEVAINLNSFIRNQMAEFMNLIGKDNICVENFSEKLQLDTIIPKLKFFVSKPETKSDYYCNYTMLLFGLNKKLFVKEYSAVNFMKDIKEWI